MALEGNLTAFGLSEILQLIAVQQKTGMLTISNVDSTTVMFFRGGEIVSTRDRRRKARDAFKDYITRYGVLDRDALLRASQIGSQSKLDFVDILTSEGFLTAEELETHWRKQIQETMHDVLTWEEGTYKFVSSRELIDGIKSPVTLNVEGMLMESMRRIDEFPQMLEVFPSERLIFSRSDDTSPSEEEMSGNESYILSLLERPVPLCDLIARGRMPAFEVYESLKSLREKGLISMEEPPADDAAPDDEDDAARAPRRAMKNVVPLLVAFALFSGATYVGLRDTVTSVSPRTLTETRLVSGGDVAPAHTEARLRWFIEAYRARHGIYPATLSALKDDGLTSAAFLDRARDLPLRYRLTPGAAGYTLL